MGNQLSLGIPQRGKSSNKGGDEDPADLSSYQNDRSCCVYLIRAGNSLKFGITTNPQDRFEQYRLHAGEIGILRKHWFSSAIQARRVETTLKVSASMHGVRIGKRERMEDTPRSEHIFDGVIDSATEDLDALDLARNAAEQLMGSGTVPDNYTQHFD